MKSRHYWLIALWLPVAGCRGFDWQEPSRAERQQIRQRESQAQAANLDPQKREFDRAWQERINAGYSR